MERQRAVLQKEKKELVVLPLGERGVAGSGLLVSRSGLLISGSALLLVTVTVSSLLLAEDTEQGKEEGSEDQDEEAEDDGVLDGGGVEGQGGGAVGGHGDEPKSGLTVLGEVLLRMGGGGEESDGSDGDDPLHCD